MAEKGDFRISCFLKEYLLSIFLIKLLQRKRFQFFRNIIINITDEEEENRPEQEYVRGKTKLKITA